SFTPTDSVDYKAATATATIVVNQATPSIACAAPAALSSGAALGPAQLAASASVPGTYSYSPAAGSILGAGPHTLSVSFTPTDSVDRKSVAEAATIVVNQGTPSITWAAPAALPYGAALGPAHLAASATLPA